MSALRTYGLLLLAGCSFEQEPTRCTALPEILLEVNAVSDVGGATVFGTVAYAQAPALDGGAGLTRFSERAVHAVYVAGEEVTPEGFNFRSWLVRVDAQRLCAFAQPGTNTASVPIRLYVAADNGVCIFEPATRTVVPLTPEVCGCGDGGC